LLGAKQQQRYNTYDGYFREVNIHDRGALTNLRERESNKLGSKREAARDGLNGITRLE
jgi:hypothetical protein